MFEIIYLLSENNEIMQGRLKVKKTKDESTYFANNRPLCIKFSFDSHKVKDWFCSVGMQQKQPSSGVLRKGCSENMQQICISNHMFKSRYWELGSELY